MNIGLDIGILSPTLFTMMVLMALITTFMTSPMLEWIYFARMAPGSYPKAVAARVEYFNGQKPKESLAEKPEFPEFIE